MWSPKGQQVMIPTPGQPNKYYGIGAVNYHTGETVVQFHRRKRRTEVAELLEALVSKHPTGTIFQLVLALYKSAPHVVQCPQLEPTYLNASFVLPCVLLSTVMV